MSITDTIEQYLAGAAAGGSSIPPKDPDATYTGQGVGGTWGNVWEWVQGRARKVRDDVEALVGNQGRAITNEIEAYTANVLQAVSGFISDLQADSLASIQESWDILQYAKSIDDEVQVIDAQVGQLTGDNYELREQIIPALLGELADLQRQAQVQKLQTEAELQDWTRREVVIPLLQQLQYQDQQTKERELVLAQQQYQYSDQQVEREQWERIAAVLLTQNQLDVIEREFQSCVNEMCETQGPGTDLGKFFKALQLATGAALLAELAALDGNGIESLLRGLQHLAHGVIDDVGAIFTGGETVGEAIGGVLGL